MELLEKFYTTTLSVSSQSGVPGTRLPSLPPLVVDPVTVSTSGDTLLPSDATERLLKGLIPMAAIITPNVQEARHLQHPGCGNGRSWRINIEWTQGCGSEGVAVLRVAREAREGSKLRASAEQDLVIATSYCTERVRPQTGSQEKLSGYTVFVRPRIQSTSMHGSGCTLSVATLYMYYQACLALQGFC